MDPTLVSSTLARKLEEVQDKLVEMPSSLVELSNSLLGLVQSKSTPVEASPLTDIKGTISSLVDTVEPPSDTSMDKDPMSQLTGLFSSIMGGKNNSFMNIISQTMGSMQKFSVKPEDILAWRSIPEMTQLLSIDPRARYMYLSPTPFMPSLSGLYIELHLESKPMYLLFTSQQSTPLVYGENVLTREFVEKLVQEETEKLDPMLKMMATTQLSQHLNLDSYWKYIDLQLDPSPSSDSTASSSSMPSSSTSRRRPVYIED
jgi:hypothetical protein